jgi:hypothetical protein
MARTRPTLAVAAATLALLAAAPPEAAAVANGCGPAGLGRLVPDRPLGFDFHLGCRRHDDCYAMPWELLERSWRAAKRFCDDAFADDLGTTCLLAWPQRRRRRCRAIAWLYVRAVRSVAGQAAYALAQARRA